MVSLTIIDVMGVALIRQDTPLLLLWLFLPRRRLTPLTAVGLAQRDIIGLGDLSGGVWAVRLRALQLGLVDMASGGCCRCSRLGGS